MESPESKKRALDQVEEEVVVVPNSKKARTDELEVASCPICLDTYYEPQSFDCGHSICIACISTMQAAKTPVQCPECKCPGAYHPNYALARVVEKTFPEEWTARKTECELIMWTIAKEKSGMKVRIKDPNQHLPHLAVNQSEMLQIAKALDKANIWTSQRSSAFMANIFGDVTCVWSSGAASLLHNSSQAVCVSWGEKSVLWIVKHRRDASWLKEVSPS